MELTGAIVNMKQAELGSKIQFAVARKILDQQQAQGAAAVKLIESAAKIGAQAGDQLLAAALGLGGAVDTYG
jgi:hypothetical protein